MRRRFYWCVMIGMLGIGACEDGDGTTGIQDNRELGRLRFVHAASDVPTIDYFIDGKIEFGKRPVGSTSSYVDAKVDALVAVVDGGTGDVLTTGGLSLSRDRWCPWR